MVLYEKENTIPIASHRLVSSVAYLSFPAADTSVSRQGTARASSKAMYTFVKHPPPLEGEGVRGTFTSSHHTRVGAVAAGLKKGAIPIHIQMRISGTIALRATARCFHSLDHH